MSKYNIGQNIIRAIEQLWKSCQRSLGERFRITIGISKTVPLSPTLFNIFFWKDSWLTHQKIIMEQWALEAEPSQTYALLLISMACQSMKNWASSPFPSLPQYPHSLMYVLDIDIKQYVDAHQKLKYKFSIKKNPHTFKIQNCEMFGLRLQWRIPSFFVFCVVFFPHWRLSQNHCELTGQDSHRI